MVAQSFSVCYSPLSLLEAKEQGIITRLKSQDDRIIKKLLAMGVNQGLSIVLEQKFPSFVIRVGRTRLAIDREIANSIYVKVIHND